MAWNQKNNSFYHSQRRGAIYLADRVVVLSPKKKGVSDIIDINIPRPRNVYSTDFVDLRHKVLEEVKGGAQ